MLVPGCIEFEELDKDGSFITALILLETGHLTTLTLALRSVILVRLARKHLLFLDDEGLIKRTNHVKGELFEGELRRIW